ncbi:MAG: peptidylprolyl isomerase [archaeon]
MTVKKGDFIELAYTGTVKDTGKVFDTTDPKIATENELNEKAEYKPVIVVLGEGHLIKGLDKFVEGKNLDQNYEIEIKDEDAFGKKSAKLLKLIPMKTFKDQQISPFPGLEVNVDNTFGIVRNVSGGRVIIDFNHPLASHDLIYKFKITRVVSDKKEQVEALLKLFDMKFKEISIAEDKATVKLNTELPKEILDKILEDVKRLAKLKDVTIQKQ